MPTCVELGTCVFSTPMDYFTITYTMLIGNLIFPIVWGGLLFLLYLRTHSGMLTGYAGLVIFSLFVSYNVITSSTSAFFNWGYILLAASLGVTFFVLIKYRSQMP